MADLLAELPHMRDYLEETQVYAPYLMHFQRPEVRRASFSTDAFGFRRTRDGHGEWLSLERFQALPAAARPSALVGNSTAFGVGATCDERALASELNRRSAALFFNFAGRTLNPLQELFTFLLFAPARVDTAVIMSGVNLLDMSYRFATDAHVYLPPFHVERLFHGRLAHEPVRSLSDRLRRAWRRLRGRDNVDPFAKSPLLAELAKGLGDIGSLAAETSNVERALVHFEHVLDLWRALQPARIRRLLFALQPVPDWFARPFGDRERALVDASEAHRPPAWKDVRHQLAARAAAFRDGLRQRLRDRGIETLDLNTEPRLVAVPWVFIDRYHLTDEAQAVIAQILAEAVA
jgi:hypothetical protein